jgi:flagellar motor protein MotB
MANNQPAKFGSRLNDKLEKQFEEIDLYEEEEHEDHVDEKWLVSYADMMTLLFGLFVMLYAIAMETQGRPDQFFADLVAGKSTLAEIQGKIAEKTQILESLKSEMSKVKAELIEKTKNLTSAIGENEKFKALVAQLQGELQQVQLQEGKHLPSGNEKSFTKDIALLKQLNEEKVKDNKKISDGNKTLTAQLKESKKQIHMLTSQNQSLNNKLQEFTKEAKSDNFMIIVLKWETEKHDLDLIVTDPSGRNYNFNNRTYEASNAKFVLDSRSGPGVEMWETPQLELGDYKIEFNFYNSYGNNNPAKLSGTIITRKGEFVIPKTQLDMKIGKKKIFTLKTFKNGNVTIQPLQ